MGPGARAIRWKLTLTDAKELPLCCGEHSPPSDQHLPPQWEVRWSPLMEKWHYQDAVTGACSWTQPTGCSLALPSNPPVGLNNEHVDAIRVSLYPGWEVEYCVKSKCLLYFNPLTGELTWTLSNMISQGLQL